MPRSYNGTGTMFYGKADRHPDGSCVVTEWVTFLWFPLIPLGSFRLWFQNQESRYFGNSVTTHYKVTKVALHTPHVYKGLAVTVGIFAALALAQFLS